ncbi:MAG TPA: hypothetical protein DCY48_03210 [Candidatus Magasanikbacteria bacterium]|nr:MAG: hypothetical protein A3I74_04345 [Candidatus Magasanikbacteria bacterium RIFCSPLOWO2_02_FULL_47_16]OGH79385.1 MAG: hypothetical protein A3C10_04880 [Candidatus Magasanikbacteria bacterium RIFCSPHIGHO2_02_FULL_48_18]OGH82497.1 MAG: hypothetical protein A3G08_00765 [Candidatus Magasanikbacteria bacterium RIFCSPLOWO2_12_FULL_47_9b]HAZ28754.1 hypothetical protein [Candidatus Magasanikbacteria bacterium]
MHSTFEEKNKIFFDRHAVRYDNALGRFFYFDHLYKRAMEIIEKYVQEKLRQRIQVADIPCGTGEMIFRLAKKHSTSQFVGVDLSKKMIEKAKQKCAEFTNTSFHIASVNALPIETERIDLLLCMEAFHHFEDPHIALEEFRRVMKPDATLLLVDPAFNRHIWKQLARKIVRPLEFAHDYYSTDELQTLLTQHKFSIESKEVYWLNSFVTAKK